MYAYVVIGKGLFGSAAARYLSRESNSVALVGPDEPAEWATHTGVFASHYDEARIVSTSAPDEVWVVLDKAAINEYPTIEAQSGIGFFTPSGRLSAVARGEDRSYTYLPIGAINSHAFTADTFPANLHFHFPKNYDIILEEQPSGFLNPRAMVKAQTAIAQQQGTTVFPEMVTRVQNSRHGMMITLQSGEVIQAQKVLLTAGSFVNCFELVDRKLAIKPESVPTLLAEVSPDDGARLAHLPPLNFRTAVAPMLDLSILPPLLYPDGRHYVKVVVNSDADQIQPDFALLSGWFRSDGDFIYAERVKQILAGLLPNVAFLSWQTKPCAVCYTPSGKPIIDRAPSETSGTGQLYVAVGGNVGAAHPSDAIGKLAADLMIHERWMSELDHHPFQLQLADEHADWMKIPTKAIIK